MAKGSRGRGLDRAIDILDCLHKHGRPMVINELAAAMDAPRSSVYELTKVLLNRSVLDTYDGGRVYLGRKLFSFGQAVHDQQSLIELTKPFIDELSEACGERAELNVLVDWKQSILYQAPGPRLYFFPSNPGAHYPLPLTGSSRFLIAGIDEATLRERIPEEDYYLNGKRVMTFERFLDESRAALARGYCAVSGLLDHYLSAIVMPITDSQGGVIATIGLALPSGELAKNEERFLQRLTEAQARIQERLSASE